MLGLAWVVLLFGTLSDAHASDAEFRRALAAHHAPVVLQGQGVQPRADVFTRFDYDGDFTGDNNWENFRKNPLPPAVYYDVIETQSHWYVTYAFFYPRDYAAVCFWIICHENDMEGSRVTVKKNGTRFGSLVLLETLAHNVNRADENPLTVTADERTVIVIEHGGHGIHSWNERKPDRKTKIYSVESAPGTGTPVLTGSVPFALLPVLDLWKLRGQVGKKRTYGGTFDYRGTRFAVDDLAGGFAGRRWSNDKAMPPWAWHHTNRTLARGDWFLDPALSVCGWIECDTRHSAEYVFHPYLGVE